MGLRPCWPRHLGRSHLPAKRQIHFGKLKERWTLLVQSDGSVWQLDCCHDPTYDPPFSRWRILQIRLPGRPVHHNGFLKMEALKTCRDGIFCKNVVMSEKDEECIFDSGPIYTEKCEIACLSCLSPSEHRCLFAVFRVMIRKGDL